MQSFQVSIARGKTNSGHFYLIHKGNTFVPGLHQIVLSVDHYLGSEMIYGKENFCMTMVNK